MLSVALQIILKIMNIFIRKQAVKEYYKLKILKAANELDKNALDSANLREDYNELYAKYLASLDKIPPTDKVANEPDSKTVP